MYHSSKKYHSCIFISSFKYKSFIERNDGSSGNKEDKANETDEGNNIKEVIKEAKAAARVSFFCFFDQWKIRRKNALVLSIQC